MEHVQEWNEEAQGSREHEFVYQFSVGCFVNGGGVEDTDRPNVGTCQKLREID